jgi:hypothetical protein
MRPATLSFFAVFLRPCRQMPGFYPTLPDKHFFCIPSPPSNWGMIDEWWSGKDFEGTGLVLMEVLYQTLRRSMQYFNHGWPLFRLLFEPRYLHSTNLDHYSYTTKLGTRRHTPESRDVWKHMFKCFDPQGNRDSVIRVYRTLRDQYFPDHILASFLL